MKTITKCGSEADTVSRKARKFLSFRAGQRAYWKRKMRRRERHSKDV